MANARAEVPFYGLYGEPLINSEPGFVHIEDIADRSEGLHWRIKAHRHSRLFQVVCVQDGRFEAMLDGDKHPLSGTWIVTIPAGTAHGFRFQPDSVGFVLSIENSVLNNSLESGNDGDMNELLQIPQLIDCSGDSEYFADLLGYIGKIREEFSQYRVKRSDALALLSELALLCLNRQIWQTQFHKAANTDSQSLRRFWSLLETHFREHWPVSRYAEQLHMSTSTLSRLCHEYVGESPKTIIQSRVLGEAKRRLLYSQQSIEKIAYNLGFKDQAYFTRFFKGLEGKTPGNYRRLNT